MHSEVFITAAARTPVGKFMGGLSGLAAKELGAKAISGALARAGMPGDAVDDVIMGQVLTAGQGQNPARQAGIAAGIPVEATALSLNLMCGSGLRAVALGAQNIALGDSQIVVAGGQENMSAAPHCAPLRAGRKMGDMEMIDTMLRDGLTDAMHGGHMGVHTESLAREYQITRAEQEEFALSSQQKTGAAMAAGRFEVETLPITVKGRKGDVTITADEFPRPDVSLEQMQALRPAFEAGGTITAATASGVNDGAAALVLASAAGLETHGSAPLARITSWASAGVEPRKFGLGPVPAIRKALAKAGLEVGDMDLIELNEAYAAQSLAVMRDLGLDPEKVNVNGGALAIGHPIGASGARVLVTLLHELALRDLKRGLASLCIGGGMGVAMCIERV